MCGLFGRTLYNLFSAVGHVKPAEVLYRNETAFVRVGSGVKVSSEDLAKKIQKNVVVLDSAVLVKNDAVERGHKIDYLDFESNLFEDLSAHRGFEALAQFHEPSGNRPLAQSRRVASFYQQDLGSPEYDCPHSSVGPFRITPVHVISDLRPTIGLDENWMRDILKVQPIALFASEDLKQTL